MRHVLTVVLSVSLLSTSVGILVALGCGFLLRRRRERLEDAWHYQCARNIALAGHPGPIDLDDFPGMPEMRADLDLYYAVWHYLTSMLALSGFGLSAVVFVPHLVV